MGKRPTIQMVADRAGVSRGTVDRVLNNRAYVKDEIRKRVLDAIAEVGYMTPREVHKQILGEEIYTPIRLGVLLPNWNDYCCPAILQGVEGAQKELQAYNVEILVDECVGDSPEEVTRRLDAMVEQGVRGIALCAVNNISVENKVTQLVDSGCPVITLNTDLPNSKRLSFVGQDYNRSGRIAAELISKCIPPDGYILAACGNREFDGHSKRIGGFLERMKELHFSDSQIEVRETFNDYYVTYRTVTEVLTRGQEIAAIYMANNSIEGCADALEAAGKATSVRLVVHDLWDGTRKLLQSGCVDFTISQDFYRQGYLPLKCLRELIQMGKTPDPDQTNVPISVICAENMD